tara:strand:+ start:337 stop:1431 length:1095 start_codon:yes stop_codon:yes gene_type:complete
LQVSWLLDKKVDLWQSYIDDTYLAYKNTYGEIRIDLLSGENRYGNKIPNKSISRLFSVFFSKTKFKTYYNYIWLDRHKIDILHIKRSYLFPVILTLLKNKDRPKIVITLRGSDTYLWPWVSEKWINFFSSKGFGIDAFIVQSKDQKLYAIKKGLPKEKISIIPATVSKLPNIIKPRTLKNNQTVKIVSVYRFTWQKNIQGNLLFIKKLRESILNIEYNIYGKGDILNTSQIYYLADRLGISDIIKIYDTKSNESIRKEFGKHDFILQLSLSESLGVSILEAMQVGLIPIVSNIGGLKDIVENNVTGLIEDSYNLEKIVLSFVSLWNNPLKYFSMSKSCIDFVNEKYNNDVECQKLYNLYKKLTG